MVHAENKMCVLFQHRVSLKGKDAGHVSENAVNAYDLCMRKDAAGLWALFGPSGDGVASVSKMIEADGSLSAAWPREIDECFAEELVGLAPALGADRAGLVQTFEVAIFRSNACGALSETVISLLSNGAHALYYSRVHSGGKHLRMLDVREVMALRALLEKIDVPRWRACYRHDDEWAVDDNYWSLELVGSGRRIKCSGSLAAPDGYARLAQAMLDLVSEDARKRKRKLKKLKKLDVFGSAPTLHLTDESEARAKAMPTRSESGV